MLTEREKQTIRELLAAADIEDPPEDATEQLLEFGRRAGLGGAIQVVAALWPVVEMGLSRLWDGADRPS